MKKMLKARGAKEVKVAREADRVAAMEEPGCLLSKKRSPRRSRRGRKSAIRLRRIVESGSAYKLEKRAKNRKIRVKCKKIEAKSRMRRARFKKMLVKSSKMRVKSKKMKV